MFGVLLLFLSLSLPTSLSNRMPIKAAWSDPGRCNNIFTGVHYFICSKVRELGIEYARVMQPVSVRKGARVPKEVEGAALKDPNMP